MKTAYLERCIQEKLTIRERSVFGEITELKYCRPKNPKPRLISDFNNLSNNQILNIVKGASLSLNYKYYSISIFQIENYKICFFTQKINGKKSSLSQIFVDNTPILILETSLLSTIEDIITNYSEYSRNIPEMLNLFSKYEYR